MKDSSTMGNCAVCTKEYKKKQKNQKYCSYTCKREAEKEQNMVYRNSTLNYLTSSKIGAISELEMCAYYVRQGYEVFRNVTPDGPADIIIWNPKNGELHIIDIKSYVSTADPNAYAIREEAKKECDTKVIPYDYNSRMPLRPL